MHAARSDASSFAQRAHDLAQVAVILAEEASAIALLHVGEGHDSRVAARAAGQAREAAELLRELAGGGARPEETLHVATWALSAASVALTQAKLNTSLSSNGHRRLDVA